MVKNKKMVFSKKTDPITKSNKRNGTVRIYGGQETSNPPAQITVRRGCPAVLKVESRKERERTLQIYEKKRSMIKAKMKNSDGEWRTFQIEQK